jgi:nitronate monooxygenase
VQLTASVADLGGLGSFGAHQLPPEAIGALVREIKAHTSRPFAVNLWVSNRDPGGDELTPEQFDAAFALYEPYYRELGLTKPARPVTFGESFEDQARALIESEPPAFSFVFGVPSGRSPRGVQEARHRHDRRRDLHRRGLSARPGGHRPDRCERFSKPAATAGIPAARGRIADGTFALTQLLADRVRAP